MKTPWSREPGTLFWLKIEKNQKIHEFKHKKGGSHFFDIVDPPPPRPANSKKWLSSAGGGGGSKAKVIGDAFVGQNNDLTKGLNQ